MTRPPAVDQPAGSTGPAADLLTVFQAAEVLSSADVQVARTIGRLGAETEQSVLLAAALTVRAARLGSVCIDLADQSLINPQLPWPDPEIWLPAVVHSRLTGQPGVDEAKLLTGLAGSGSCPLQWDHGRLYLNRYRQQEADLTDDLMRRWNLTAPSLSSERLAESDRRLFPGERKIPDGQRLAAQVAAGSWTMFLTGGPGTGKTVTIAKMLAMLTDQPGPALRIALAAPTGKAAARLTQAMSAELITLPVRDQQRLGALPGGAGGPLTATTIHRLLGPLPDNNSRFRHHRRQQLPFDVVVIDETSMVSLSLLARLVEAISDQTRLILVGDPDQLSAVEAGAAFADLIDGARRGKHAAEVVRLNHNHRFHGEIADLAAAVRDSDADRAIDLLSGESSEISLRASASASDAAMLVYRAAAAGADTEARHLMSEHRVLCGHRSGPVGVQQWNQQIERGLIAAGMPTPWDPWYLGRQLLVTENDYSLGLFNGDTGVVVRGADGLPAASFGAGLSYRPSRLQGVQTAFAMTVHRSQGSQFGRVTLVLPPLNSPLLTRELLYTGITRAQYGVEIIGTAEAIRAALAKPAARASGIARRLLADRQ